jgi:hypothetical protein
LGRHDGERGERESGESDKKAAKGPTEKQSEEQGIKRRTARGK